MGNNLVYSLNMNFENKLKYSDFQKSELLRNIFAGNINIFNLPENLYLTVAKELEKGIYQGFGYSLAALEIGSPNYELLYQLRNNIYVFSGAKTFQDTKDIGRLIFDRKGFKRSFGDFQTDANKLFKTRYKHWLRAEFDMAIKQADSAAKWQVFQEEKEELPLLEFQTAGDGRVRSDHQAYDGIILPVDDPFWDSHTPPLEWGCRCMVIQRESGRQTAKQQIKKRNIKPPDKLFAMNPGKDKMIFDEKKHPNFKVAEKYRVMKDNNFGFSIPAPK